MLRCKPGNRGFSLLELIITIAILSAGITVLLQAFSFSSRITGLSNDMIRAVFLAEDKLGEMDFKERKGLINQEPSLGAGTSGKFQWRSELELDKDLNLYQFNFLVTWERANRVEQVNIKTYLK